MGKRRLGKKRASSSAASTASSASGGGAGEQAAAGTAVAAGVLAARTEITVRPVAADPAPPSPEPASRGSDWQKRQKRWEDDDGGAPHYLHPAPGTPSQAYEFRAPRYHDFTAATPNAFAAPACLSFGAQRSDTHDGTPLDPAKVRFRDRESLSDDNSSVFSDGGNPSFLGSGGEEGAHSDGDNDHDAWFAECTVPTKGESESEVEDGDDDDGSRTVVGRITSPTTRLPDVEGETDGWRARPASCLRTDVSAEIPLLELGGEPAATQRSTGPKDGTPSRSLSIAAARSTGPKDGMPLRSLSITEPTAYSVASISSPPQRVPVGQVWDGDKNAEGTGKRGAHASQQLSSIHSSGVISEREPRCGSSVAAAYALKTRPARTSTKAAPSQPNFVTDKRLRRSREREDEDLAMLRRKAGTSRGVTKRKSKKANLEVLKPFAFHRSGRSRLGVRKADGDDDGKVGSPFVPLAVKVKEFDKTPDRFKSKPTRKAANKALQRIIDLNAGPTQPKSPKFATKFRAKPSRFEPTEERLAREAKSAANSFKAKPINYRIFESHGDLGVPKIAKPQLTAPISPRFSKRPDPRHFVESDIAPASTTVRANPVPHEVLDNPFRPVISHRTIKPAPFTLVGESVRAARLEEKQELLRRLREQEESARRFKANPLPDFSEALATKKPEKKKARDRPAPAPFHFRTDLRGEAYQARLRKQLDDERALREKENKFSAQVAPLAINVPFVPKRSSKKLTATEDVTLQTDIRAEERRRLAEQQREKEREEERIREEARVADEKRAREELRRFRKDLVHHAQPVRNFARVHIHPSGKALTQAKSPLIGRKRRAAKETCEQEWTEADGGGGFGEQWQEDEGRAM